MKGVMADTAASPNDPIFISHHAMVDCILEKWLQSHRNAVYPTGVPITQGHRGNDYIVPFFPLYTHNDMFETASSFGYSCNLDDQPSQETTSTNRGPGPGPGPGPGSSTRGPGGSNRGAGASWVLQAPVSSWILPAAILWNMLLTL